MKTINTKEIAYTALFTALYVVLSVLIKIPVTEHIALDLGYISLTVCAVYMGAVPAAVTGGLRAFFESAMMGQRGVSPGWILMNLIVGYACGRILQKTRDKEKKTFMLSAFFVIPLSMLAGVAVKTLVDCVLYSLPLIAKIPTGLAAWVTDSAVMLAIGVPLSIALRKRVKI